MSERELSDDHALWPGDPFALLGLSPAAGERDARRAYTRLIKRFKPDHHPEHFQKIREAFEFVQRQALARERYRQLLREERSQPVEDDPDDERVDADEAGGGLSDPAAAAAADDPELMSADEVASRGSYSIVVSPQRGPTNHDLPAPRDAVADLWQQALEGHAATAYAGLVQIVDQRRTADESAPPADAGQLYARLFWLLTLHPDLDGARTPYDWLVHGLAVARLIGPLAELYRRELAANPHEALSPRCDALVDRGGLPRGLCDLLLWRWQAAAALRRSDVILRDLAAVRERLVFDDEAAWGQTLLNAVELLVWLPEAGPLDTTIQSSVRSILAELEQLSHLHQQLGDGYDRLDMLVEVARGFGDVRRSGDIPPEWAELIPLAWTRPFEELRPRVVELLRTIVTHPLRSLRTLDAIHERSPAASAQLGMLIHRFQVEEGVDLEADQRPWPQALELAAAFFRQKMPGPYYLWRAKLLEFCLAEGIHPGYLAAAMDELAEQAGATGDSARDAIRNDGPLRYIWSGTQAFWG